MARATSCLRQIAHHFNGLLQRMLQLNNLQNTYYALLCNDHLISNKIPLRQFSIQFQLIFRKVFPQDEGEISIFWANFQHKWLGPFAPTENGSWLLNSFSTIYQPARYPSFLNFFRPIHNAIHLHQKAQHFSLRQPKFDFSVCYSQSNSAD